MRAMQCYVLFFSMLDREENKRVRKKGICRIRPPEKSEKRLTGLTLISKVFTYYGFKSDKVSQHYALK